MPKKFEAFIFEALHQFSATKDNEASWALAQKLLTQIGASAINFGVISEESGNLNWFRSSMSAQWLSDYVSGAFHVVDPVLDHLLHGTGSVVVKTGVLNREAAPDQKAWVLNHELHDAGYGGFYASEFSGAAHNERKFVSLVSDTRAGGDFEGLTRDQLQLFSTILAANLGPPEKYSSDDLFFSGMGLLSPREKEVLTLLAVGLRNDEIAYRMSLAEVTVRKHMQSARRKLRATSREQALVIALRTGLISV